MRSQAADPNVVQQLERSLVAGIFYQPTKLEAAGRLGASHGVNYRDPEWSHAAKRLAAVMRKE